MANRWQYPRWRRATMQAVMWVVLAGSLAAAALVSRRQGHGFSVSLGERRFVDNFSVRFPKGWERAADPRGEPSVIDRAEEPSDDGTGRVISLRVVPRLRSLSPIDFLAREGLPRELLTDDGRGGAGRAIQIAGRPGVMTGGLHQIRSTGADGSKQLVPYRVYFAGTVLPTREGVLLTLEAFGQPEPDDVDILARVATALELRNAPAGPVSAAVVVLPGGIRMPVPTGYGVFEEDDPNRRVRTLIAPDASTSTIDLIPCLMTGLDTDADRVTLAELNEPAFHGGRLVPRPTGPGGTRQWEIQLADGGSNPNVAVRAYLAADKSGTAVLAIFRGDPDGAEGDVRSWETIVGGLKFDTPVDPAPYVQAGERAVARLKQAGLGQLAGDARGDRWWLWFRDGPDQFVGWSKETIYAGPTWKGRRQARWRDDRSVMVFGDAWEGDATLTTYQRKTGASPGTLAGPVKTQWATLSGGQLSLSTSSGSNRPTDPDLKRAVPQNFVPGPWLAAVLGKLGDDTVLLKTDCFPGFEPALKGGLLSLLVESSDEFVRPAEDGSGPMRCLTVKVNGSGETSRWYFTPDGQVAQIDFADGMHRKPSKPDEVEFAFKDDAKMRP